MAKKELKNIKDKDIIKPSFLKMMKAIDVLKDGGFSAKRDGTKVILEMDFKGAEWDDFFNDIDLFR